METMPLSAWKFLGKPWREKVASFYFRWIRILPSVPVPIHLPFGSWWLARRDTCSSAILRKQFEEAEQAFLERLLRPGMTVFDIGAHHGLYTLLASKSVGPAGRVVSFEPSSRERHNLLRHVRWNRCTNVSVEPFALGDSKGEAELFVVVGDESGCNSLRQPNVEEPTRTELVRTVTLDEYVATHEGNRIDVIKLDVEGAELSVLKGARETLSRRPRPIILAEVQDIRTGPWGYPAARILAELGLMGFCWFQPRGNGGLERVGAEMESPDGNYVAVPEERMGEILGLLGKETDVAPASGQTGSVR